MTQNIIIFKDEDTARRIASVIRSVDMFKGTKVDQIMFRKRFNSRGEKPNAAQSHLKSVCRRALRLYRQNGGPKQPSDYDRDYYDVSYASSALQPKAPAWLKSWKFISRYYKKEPLTEAQKLLGKKSS